MARRLRDGLMALYTLIIDYEGGTYVMQAHADSAEVAPSACIEKWDISDIKHIFTEEYKASILTQLETEYLTALVNMKNVWYGNISLNDNSLTFNLILTDK
ncbi:MAG: hypothetical protein ACKE8R_05280 [Methylophagaceae bacterium]